MTDYPSPEYLDWQRARGHMSGTVPLRTLEQARSDLAEQRKKRRSIRLRMCEECGVYSADYPSKMCSVCEAYKEHQV